MSAVPRCLVIGATGYVGRALTELLPSAGMEVIGSSRRVGADVLVAAGPDLDRLLCLEQFDQIVLTAQLGASNVDWLVDRIDGPRWAVLSSAQLTAGVLAPGAETAIRREAIALARGATVLRPTMIFGRGGDANISRMIRALHRWRIGVQFGDGRQLVQPLHIADLASLLTAHARQPRAGMYSLGGDTAIPLRDLYEVLGRLLGLRLPAVRVPPAGLRIAARLGLAGLRADQVGRLVEDKTVDLTEVSTAFGWSPASLESRLQQAVDEISQLK